MSEDDDEWEKVCAAWRERIGDQNLSVREYYDSHAELMRPRNIEMLEGLERLGWIQPRANRMAAMQEAFRECGFDLRPKSGWTNFCYELDLIFVALPDQTDERNIGHAALAKQIEAEVEYLRELKSRLIGISHNVDFVWAAFKSESQPAKIWNGISEAGDTLSRIAETLKASPQKPRWRERAQREFRVGLATKTMTLFEREFGIEAKPIGGSASTPLEDTNEWTKFFQGCAFLLMGERVSPDRQAILWKAFGDR